MNKEDTLTHLRNAKKAHITWVQRAHALSDDDRSFISKLFGTRKKVTSLHQEIAKDYYMQIKGVSEKLIEGIDRLERRIYALQDGKFCV